jgi:NADH-quinone oxidoreductase subunit M
MPNLIILLAIPFVAASIVALSQFLTGRPLKIFAFILSVLPLAILLIHHDSWLGTTIQYNWIPILSIQFHLNIDSLSLLFLYLTAIIVPVTFFALRSSKVIHPHSFYALILLLQGLLLTFFTARDLVLFTIFWEAIILPLYFIIALWGGDNRKKAALKFLIYMVTGSALMVVAVLALYFSSVSQGTPTFNLDALAGFSSSLPYAPWLLAIFLFAFAVKTPLFPFHAWLPDTYTQAPVAGTILLSALLSKAGIYGIVRIGMELFPTQLSLWSPWLLGLAIAGVLYGGLAAWMQNDYKRLIAYSSFSHVNFILAGLFVWDHTAQGGAILQALNHGVTIAALFLVAGWLQERLGSTAIGQSSGLAKFLPILCWLTLFFVLASVALPGTNNFIGEVMILFGLFVENPWAAAILGLTIILSVIYMLRWMQKMYFEEPVLYQDTWKDIGIKELTQALPLIALVLWVGIYPAPVLKYVKQAADKIITVAKSEVTQ